MFKRFTAIATLLLLPFAAQADIAGDIEAGLPADEVVANALDEGMSLVEVMNEVAQVVGSANVPMFAGAAARVYAARIGASVDSDTVNVAVNIAVGAATSANYSATSAGQSYAMKSANFAPASALAGGGATPGGTAPGGAAGGGSGGGGGQVVEDALCEAAGSEPGCLDAA